MLDAALRITTSEKPCDPAVMRVSFRVSARLACRGLAIDLVSTLTEHVTTSDRSFRNAMTTAFGEAFNNIVIHGYGSRTDGIIDVEAELGAEHMTLRLMDYGNSVDLAAVMPPDLDCMPEGGLGVFMIRAMVDDIVYRDGSPNVMLLTKRTTLAASAASPELPK